MKRTRQKNLVSNRKHLRSGDTLVEVIVAVVIIAILAIVATTALMYPTHLVVSDARRQVALHEAGRDMEQAKAISYGDLNGGTTNYTFKTLHKTMILSRIVDETTYSDAKIITVKIPDPADTNAPPLVELITVRTQ